MPTDVVMPQMGESIFEGTITKWLKRAGDRVEKDEPLFEISTDKVDAEIPSPEAGILTEIKVPEGATVEVDTVVAVIGGGAAAQTEPASDQLPDKEQAWTGRSTLQPAGRPALQFDAPQVGESPWTTQVKGTGFSPYIGSSNSAGALAPEGRLSAELAAVGADLTAQQQGRRSSPLVRRIAKENNLDLSQIAGSGSQGRITKEDILRHLSQIASGSRTSPPAPKSQLAAPQGPQMLSKMRAIIAQRMVESVRISPHVHTVYKIDMTRIARIREREKARFELQHGVKLTYMPFIASAAAQALRKFPILNASMIGDSIHYHQQINLGIAVALEWGLIVPVVRQAETLSFLSLARAIADLAGRARAKKLQPEEVQGGTFTLTNSGVYGGEFGTPIINQPESAILAIGGLRKEPVVLTDAEGHDTIAIRSMQHYCLGFDHRTIDGAEAGKFMSDFKQTLETWEQAIG
jgi:2-oxoglutarate dehydrogenase E2 component (dihydrolipoamide succinyltransferase)